MKKVAAIVALAGLSTGLLWTVGVLSHVERYEEVRQVDPWSEKASFAYAPLLADGSELPPGEPGYFDTEAPRVRILFSWALQDPTAERVTALATMRLVVEHPATPGRPAWTHVEEIANATHAGHANAALELDGAIDLPATAARIEATPGRDIDDATWTIAATVRFASAPNAAHKGEASETTLPILYHAPLYSIPDAGETTKDHTQRETIVREERASLDSLAERPLGPILLLASLLVLVPTIPSLTEDDEEMPI